MSLLTLAQTYGVKIVSLICFVIAAQAFRQWHQADGWTILRFTLTGRTINPPSWRHESDRALASFLMFLILGLMLLWLERAL